MRKLEENQAVINLESQIAAKMEVNESLNKEDVAVGNEDKNESPASASDKKTEKDPNVDGKSRLKEESKGKKRKRKELEIMPDEPENHVNDKLERKKKKEFLEEPNFVPKMKKDDQLRGISDNRLLAYGQNPKKVRRILKYGNKQNSIG